jgi:hypothetical protein
MGLTQSLSGFSGLLSTICILSAICTEASSSSSGTVPERALKAIQPTPRAQREIYSFP